jgi:hypothetical protein
MDNLEKYIRENRAAFDKEQPPKRIWEQLDKTLPQKKNKPIRLWRGFQVAAAVLLLLSVGGVLGSYLTNRNFAAENIASKLPDDFTELENYYQREVSSKMKQLASVNMDEDQVSLELDQLDAALEELKEDILLAPKGTEEQIINAMILNYKTKIDLLETIMTHIKAQSNSNPQNIKNNTKNEGINL